MLSQIRQLLFATDAIDQEARSGALSGSAARSVERIRSVLSTGGFSIIAKFVSIGGNLLLIPALLKALSLETFGTWVVITTFSAYFSFADLGIGSGLVNRIARLRGLDDKDAIRRSTANAYLMLTFLSLLFLTLIGVLTAFGVDISPTPAGDPVNARQTHTAFLIFVVLFCINIPLSLVARFQFSMMAGDLAAKWLCVTSLASTLSTFGFAIYGFSLPVLVSAYSLPPLLFSIINSVVFYRGANSVYLPKKGDISPREVAQLLHSGSMFFVMQITSSLAYNSDALLIGRILGPQATATFSVPERLLSFPVQLLAMLLLPLWPAYAEAMSRGDAAWGRRILKQSLILSVGLSGAVTTLLVAAMPIILHYWVEGRVAPSLSLLFGLGLWKMVETTSYAVSAYLNAANYIRFQTAVCLCFAICVFPAKYAAYQAFGINGGVWAVLFCYSLCPGVPYFIVIRRELSLRPKKLT